MSYWVQQNTTLKSLICEVVGNFNDIRIDSSEKKLIFYIECIIINRVSRVMALFLLCSFLAVNLLK